MSTQNKTLAGEKIGAKHSGDHKPREPQTPQKPPASGKTYAPRLGSTKAICTKDVPGGVVTSVTRYVLPVAPAAGE